MDTRTVEIEEDRAHLPELLSITRHGGEVIIADAGMPLARLVPIAPNQSSRIAGLHRGEIWTSDDFDSPLPDDYWIGAS